MSSTSSTSDLGPATVRVGRILRPHGLRGEVIVEVSSDVAERFSPGSPLLLSRPDGGHETVRVVAARSHGQGVLVRFEGRERLEDVEDLRGRDLEVAAAEVPPAPAGAFWQHELLGARCRDREAGELGVVAGLEDQGGGLLLRIEGPRGVLLVPFVEPFVAGLDREARALELSLPAGLIETCASRS